MRLGPGSPAALTLLALLAGPPRGCEAVALPFIGYYDVFPDPYDVLWKFSPVSVAMGSYSSGCYRVW